MKLKSGIFRVERRQKTPAVGLLLVAQPFFTDEYFHRSVICIIENDDVHGTMGAGVEQLQFIEVERSVS